MTIGGPTVTTFRVELRSETGGKSASSLHTRFWGFALFLDSPRVVSGKEFGSPFVGKERCPPRKAGRKGNGATGPEIQSGQVDRHSKGIVRIPPGPFSSRCVPDWTGTLRRLARERTDPSEGISACGATPDRDCRTLPCVRGPSCGRVSVAAPHDRAIESPLELCEGLVGPNPGVVPFRGDGRGMTQRLANALDRHSAVLRSLCEGCAERLQPAKPHSWTCKPLCDRRFISPPNAPGALSGRPTRARAPQHTVPRLHTWNARGGRDALCPREASSSVMVPGIAPRRWRRVYVR